VFDKVSWSDTTAFHNTLVAGSSPTSSTTHLRILEILAIRLVDASELIPPIFGRTCSPNLLVIAPTEDPSIPGAPVSPDTQRSRSPAALG